MTISLDLVPSTVAKAAQMLADVLTDNEREYFRVTPVERLCRSFGVELRQGWSLWQDTPLRFDAARHYAIAHPDDISSLIIHWTRASARNHSLHKITASSTISVEPSWAKRRLKLVGGLNEGTNTQSR